MNMLARIVSALSLIFLVLFITFLLLMWLIPGRSFGTAFLTPSVCSSPCILGGGPGVPLLSGEPLSSIGIRYEWPKQINLNSSDTITVELDLQASVTMQYRVTPTPEGNHQVAEATPSFFGGTPVVQVQGTPEPASVAQVFGSGYQTTANAQLLTNTFDVKTFQPTEQPLDQEVVSWVWNVKPTSLGPQVINLNVDFVWHPTGKGQVIERQIWQTQVTINVTQPFLDPGQISIGTTISGALAAGGLITAIITAFVTSAFDHLWKKSGEETNTDQQKPKEENTRGEYQQEGGHTAEAQKREAKNSVPLQRSRQTLPDGRRALPLHSSRTLSKGARVLLITLALLIIGVSALVYYMKFLHPAQVSAQASAEVTNSTVTAQALLTATATGEQHILSASIGGSPLWNDPLSRNSGINRWNENSNCSFMGGSYHATSMKQGYIYVCVATSTHFVDFAYQVQLSFISNGLGCLVLRANYYTSNHTQALDAFCIGGGGYYAFITISAGKKTFNTLTNGITLPPLMKSGANATNTVTIIAQRSRYTIFINNLYVQTVVDATTSQGSIGVGALNEGTDAEIAFRNARVWKLS